MQIKYLLKFITPTINTSSSNSIVLSFCFKLKFVFSTFHYYVFIEFWVPAWKMVTLIYTRKFIYFLNWLHFDEHTLYCAMKIQFLTRTHSKCYNHKCCKSIFFRLHFLHNPNTLCWVETHINESYLNNILIAHKFVAVIYFSDNIYLELQHSMTL